MSTDTHSDEARSAASQCPCVVCVANCSRVSGSVGENMQRGAYLIADRHHQQNTDEYDGDTKDEECDV